MCFCLTTGDLKWYFDAVERLTSMRIVRNIFLGCCVVASVASASEVWAPGVSMDSGWYDFNKQRGSDILTDDGNMCWAASASNIIAWWQDQNNIVSTQKQQIPQGADVWQTFVAVFNNNGGNPDKALDWWITGKNPPASIDNTIYEGTLTWMGIDGKTYNPNEMYAGGFLTSATYTSTPLYDTSTYPITLGLNGGNVLLNQADALIAAFSRGYAFAVEVATNEGVPASHAITLWGAGYTLNEAGNAVIDYVYVTESDDAINKIYKASVNTKGDMYGLWADGLSYRVMNAVGMRSEPVPEPTTATLSLLALCGLAARRRRK